MLNIKRMVRRHLDTAEKRLRGKGFGMSPDLRRATIKRLRMASYGRIVNRWGTIQHKKGGRRVRPV